MFERADSDTKAEVLVLVTMFSMKDERMLAIQQREEAGELDEGQAQEERRQLCRTVYPPHTSVP